MFQKCAPSGAELAMECNRRKVTVERLDQKNDENISSIDSIFEENNHSFQNSDLYITFANINIGTSTRNVITIHSIMNNPFK